MEGNKTPKLQWHPAFVTGIDLDLRKYRNEMSHEREYNLNTKPLMIDVLIIKHTDTGIEDNDIARIFRKYNVVEYKSSSAHLNIDTYYKVTAYACLYKSYGERVDSIKVEELTISLFRNTKPVNLFQYFHEHDMSVSNPYPGIYYVEGNVCFSTQIIVMGELDIDKHTWLVALSGKLNKTQLRKILDKAAQITDQREKQLADSVLQVCITANQNIADELKKEEGNVMCQALLDLMEPEITQIRNQVREEAHREGHEEGMKEGIREGIKEGIKEGIILTVKSLRDFGKADEDIKAIIIKNFQLSPSELDNLMDNK